MAQHNNKHVSQLQLRDVDQQSFACLGIKYSAQHVKPNIV